MPSKGRESIREALDTLVSTGADFSRYDVPGDLNDLIDSSVPVPSVADLRNYGGEPGMAAVVGGDRGGLFVAKDSDPFGNGDDGAVAVQAGDGTWWVRKRALSGVVSVEWFNGGDVGERFNSARASMAVEGVRYVFPQGKHDLSTAINATDIRSGEIDLDLRGTKLVQKSEIGIDCTGSNDSIRVWGGQIEGDTQSPIQAGVLLARDDTDNSAGGHSFYGVKVRGKYNGAPLYNVSSEVNSFYGCNFQAKIGGTFGGDGESGVFVGADNPVGLTSPHSTIVSGSTATTTVVRFYGGIIEGHTAIHLRSNTDNPVEDITLDGTFVGATDEAVKVDLTNDRGVKRIGLHRVRVTDNIPSHVIKEEGGSAESDISFDIFKSRLSATSNIITLNTNTRVVDSKIDRETIYSNTKDLRFANIENSTLSVNESGELFANNVVESTIKTRGGGDRTINGSVTRSKFVETASGVTKRVNGSDRFEYQHVGFGGTRKNNLSGVTGSFDGQLRRDDGTNTKGSGSYCVWDASNNQWIPQDGSATFS